MDIACGAGHNVQGCGHGDCRDLGGLWCGCGIDFKQSVSLPTSSELTVISPSGKSPVLPFCMCFPRYQPSPKSSSLSISSILSPLRRLNSSGLLASKSSGPMIVSTKINKVSPQCHLGVEEGIPAVRRHGNSWMCMQTAGQQVNPRRWRATHEQPAACPQALPSSWTHLNAWMPWLG